MDAARPIVVDPTVLGPLAGEVAVRSGSTELFPGEERYLSRRQLARRRQLVAAIAPRLERLLGNGERVLWVAPMLRLARFLEALGLGVWWAVFFRVALVVTDRRLIELETDPRGRPRSERRSFPLGQATSLRLRGRTLVMKPAS